MIIAEITIDPNAWVPLVTAIGTLFTAAAVLIHAILSALGRKQMSAEIQKNTALTQDVSGKADVAAVAATQAATKVDHITQMVNSRDTELNSERKALQVENTALKDERSTQVIREVVREAVQGLISTQKAVSQPAQPTPVIIENPQPVPVTVEPHEKK